MFFWSVGVPDYSPYAVLMRLKFDLEEEWQSWISYDFAGQWNEWLFVKLNRYAWNEAKFVLGGKNGLTSFRYSLSRIVEKDEDDGDGDDNGEDESDTDGDGDGDKDGDGEYDEQTWVWGNECGEGCWSEGGVGRGFWWQYLR